ncbi:MAG: hypothetical protein Q4D71_02125 [Oscillospiraceae bacterium]|nr:hypothetical protein [Oscillospiraceae bacterium]MDO5137231.1 hypothetical protein [Oscillospiraceae bacterium]
MRKLFAVLFIALLLTACGGGTHEPVQPQPSSDPGTVAPVTPPSSGETPGKPETDQPPVGSNVKTETTDYRYFMDGYEDMEVAFLGCMYNDITLDDIIDRALNDPDFSRFSFVREITDAEIVYGLCNGIANNVYLIVPAFDTDIKLGLYSWYANEIVEVYYSAENSDPILFIEMADEMNVLSRVEYKRHLSGGDSEGWMNLGLNTLSSKLRTDYHMGIVDVTPYEAFTSAELPFYQQSFFDTLSMIAEIQSGLSKGMNLSPMEEMIYDGDVYAVFDFSDGSNHTLYGINLDFYTGERKIIKTTDYENWSTVGFG